MVKRELATDLKIDIDAPRAKRQRDGEANDSPRDGVKVAPRREGSSDHEEENKMDLVESAPSMSPEEVREEGVKVLQVLRDAVNKEGRQISYDFLRLPSKRQFPDYYEIIKRPIALDDIKAQLESHAYPSLDALREDFDTCFRNAKKYNQRESVIWKDAKTLQKMANKGIEKILRKGRDDDEGSDREGGKKKEKGVNIHRLMKNRLLKLVAKDDESGRKLSEPFMELPSKKKWAVYYKLIKRPICIEDVFKRIKRKEYHTIPDFINDVDLVFANAMDFNEERSPIWEDALTMQTYFHQIMTDLPAKYNMNGAEADSSASPEVSHNRIKLRLPGHQSMAYAEAGQTGETSSGIVRLRVPVVRGSGSGSSGGAASTSDKEPTVKKGKGTSPVAPGVSLPSTASIQYSTQTSASPPIATPATASAPGLAMPAPKPARAAAHAQMKMSPPAQTPSAPQQASTYTPFQHYTAPNHIPAQNFYTAPTTAATPQTPARGSATPAPAVPQPAIPSGRTDAPSPVPPASAVGLHSVRLDCCPPGKSQSRRRLAALDCSAGVRNFAIRVPATESKLIVRSVKYSLYDVEVEESEGEEESKVTLTPKKRGRGRPRKVAPIDQEIKPPEPKPEPAPPLVLTASSERKEKERDKREWRWALPLEVEVKLDGLIVTPNAKDVLKTSNAYVNGTTESSSGATGSGDPAKQEDEWSVDLTIGQHILEVGRKGNNVHWRVYISVS